MPFDIKFHEIPEKIRDVEHHIRKIGQVIEQGKKEAKFDIGSTSHNFKCLSVNTVVQLLNFELEDCTNNFVSCEKSRVYWRKLQADCWHQRLKARSSNERSKLH